MAEHRVYFFIPGLRLVECEDLRLGCVSLFMATSPHMSQLMEDIRSAIMTTAHDESSKQRFCESQTAEVLEVAADWAIAEVRLVPARKNVIHDASERLNRVLDLVRFSLPHWLTYSREAGFGIQAQFPSTTTSYHLHADGFSFNRDQTEFPVAIDQKAITVMQSIGVFELADLLSSVKVTDLERAILRSIHWYARAESESDTIHELLSRVISIETILIVPDERPISSWVSESTAMILRDHVGDRESLRDAVANFYKCRNEIVHGGNKFENLLVKAGGIHALRKINGDLIAWAIHHRGQFETRKDLRSALERLRLSTLWPS